MGASAWRFDFNEPGDWVAENAAIAFLEAAGFSVGRKQAPEPRGILFGDFDIQKWRNLSVSDRDALHGTLTGGRHGPVTVYIKRTAPAEAHRALHAANDALVLAVRVAHSTGGAHV